MRENINNTETEFEQPDDYTVIYREPSGYERKFCLRPYTDHGYIHLGSPRGEQVCEYLGSRGVALSASPETLLTEIQNEYFKMKNRYA